MATAEECVDPRHVEEDGERLQLVNGESNGNRSQTLEKERSILSTKASNKQMSSPQPHDTSDGDVAAQLKFLANYEMLKSGPEVIERSQGQSGRVMSGSKNVQEEVAKKNSSVLGQTSMAENKTVKAGIRAHTAIESSIHRLQTIIQLMQGEGVSEHENGQRQAEKECYSREGGKFIKLKGVGLEQSPIGCRLGSTSEHPIRISESPTSQENVDFPKELRPSSRNIGNLSFKVQKRNGKRPVVGSLHSVIKKSRFKRVKRSGFEKLDDSSRLEISGVKGSKPFMKLLAS